MDNPGFIVVCPKGVATGGPEALHQLSRSLRDAGAKSALWDPDSIRRNADAVSQYDIYGNHWLETEPAAGDVLVIPEVLSELIPKFYGTNRCIFWWLSVDNFFESESLPIEVIRDCFPKVIHAYQSEYARRFLEQIQIPDAISISDYLNPEFLKQSDEFLATLIVEKKDGLLAINPAKGLERTLQLLEKLPGERVIRLEKMTASEVSKALQRATYYLDLGNHPGKDRFPREAATQGCIVLTNKRGSAGNDIDVPISLDEFKFDDTEPDYVEKIYSKLLEMNLNPEYFSEKQAGYRGIIQAEKKYFDIEVSTLLSHVTHVISHSHKDEPIKQASLPRYLSDLLVKRDAVTQERDAVTQERDELRKRILELEKSLSWRVTHPLRYLAGLFRKRL